MTSESNTEIVKDQLEKLLALMLTPTEISVTEDIEGSLSAQIGSSEEAGLLIGKHGRTVESLELIMNLIFKQQTGEWKRISVNVGDWKEKQIERLRDLASSVAARVIETGEPQFLYNLSASQRRDVHMFLSENPSVITESEGDGAERYLIIKPA